MRHFTMLILFVLVSFSTYSSAQELVYEDPFGNCPSDRIAVVFINGIVTSEDGSHASHISLSEAVHNQVSGIGENINCFFVSNFYNKSEKLLNDAVESVELAIGQGQWRPGWRHAINLVNFDEEVYDLFTSPTVASVAVDVLIGEVTSTTEADLQIATFVERYSPRIHELVDVHGASKVILVSHSEGNWLANELYNDYVGINASSNVLHIVGAAVPAAYLAPIGGLDRYSTNYRDLIRGLSGNLPPNTSVAEGACADTAPFTVVNSYICHGFRQYMLIPETRDRIVDNILFVAGYGPGLPVPKRVTDHRFNSTQTRQIVEIGDDVILNTRTSGDTGIYDAKVIDLSLFDADPQRPNDWGPADFAESVGTITPYANAVFFLDQRSSGYQSLELVVDGVTSTVQVSGHTFYGLVTSALWIKRVGSRLIALMEHVDGLRSIYVNDDDILGNFVMRPLDDRLSPGFEPTTDIFAFGQQIVMRSNLDDFGKGLFFADMDQADSFRVMPLAGAANVARFDSAINEMIVWNDRVYFIVGVPGGGAATNYELWWTDGHTQTEFVATLPQSGFLVDAGSRLLVYGFGYMMISDGTANGTTQHSISVQDRIQSAATVDNNVYLSTYHAATSTGKVFLLSHASAELQEIFTAPEQLRSLTSWEGRLYFHTRERLYRVFNDFVPKEVIFPETLTRVNTPFLTSEHFYVDAITDENDREVWRIE